MGKKKKNRKKKKKKSSTPGASAEDVVVIHPDRDLRDPNSHASRTKRLLDAHAAGDAKGAAEAMYPSASATAAAVKAGYTGRRLEIMLHERAQYEAACRANSVDTSKVTYMAGLEPIVPASQVVRPSGYNGGRLGRLGKHGGGSGNISDATTDIGKSIEAANKVLVEKSNAKTLTADDIALHAAFLMEKRDELRMGAEALSKRSKVIAALLGRTTDRNRAERYTREHASVKRAFTNIKSDTIRFNLMLNQFQRSPAYHKMLESVNDVAVWTPSGALVVSPDLDGTQDGALSFEEMCAQEKERDVAHAAEIARREVQGGSAAAAPAGGGSGGGGGGGGGVGGGGGSSGGGGGGEEVRAKGAPARAAAAVGAAVEQVQVEEEWDEEELAAQEALILD